MAHACARCSKTDSDLTPSKRLSKCSKCGSTYYCSRECQIAHWSTHKKGCSTLALDQNLSSLSLASPSTKKDPWTSFKPFLDSISTELLSVLSIPYAPHVHSPRSERTAVWFHLHFVVNSAAAAASESSTTSDSRRAFVFKRGRRTDKEDFLAWVKEERSHIGQKGIVEAYGNRMDAMDAQDRAMWVAEGKSWRRLLCTAEDVDARFLGLSILALSSHTVTRSALDSENEKLDWVGPMKAILGSIEPSERPTKADPEAPESTELLHKVVKEFMKDERWAERSVKSWKEGAREENELLHAALLKRGVKEQVLVGGRLGKGYYYALPVSEFPTRCTCGKLHRPEEHYLDDSDEEEYGSDEDGCTPPYYNSHQGHSHDHDDGDGCGHGGHSHSH